MKEIIKNKLVSLNKKFYQAQAQSFSDTREIHWPGWEKLAEILIRKGKKLNSILDVGCGNGRFLGFLKEQGIVFANYLGIDASKKLIQIAHARYQADGNEKFQVIDVLETQNLNNIRQEYNLIVVFGLMHHIPGRENRLELLKDLASKLTLNGQLALTFWQFRKSRRFDKTILGKNQVDKVTAELFNYFEDGDYLLNWDRSDLPRYCHSFSDKEIDGLINELKRSGLRIKADYNADGQEGNLNRYLIITYAGQ
ncbi:class I SAM-dependent methyltransferase [Candidatus Dojkabacteria bacterium]|nr:class I SAM-dependent methyltransferase [Candidatus Dojkabacteria bacterium]